MDPTMTDSAGEAVADAGQAAMRQMVESLGLAAPPSGETAFAMATQGRPEPTRAAPAAVLPKDAPQETATETETPSTAESPVTHAQLQQLLEMVRSQPATSQPAPEPVKAPEPPKPETLDDRMLRAQKAMAREILGVNASEAEINEVAAEAVKIMRLQDTKASIGDGGKDISAALDEELASTRRKLEERTQSVSALSEIKNQIAALQAKLDAKEQEAAKASKAQKEQQDTAAALLKNEAIRAAFPGFASLVTDEASGQAVAGLLWELSDGGTREVAKHLDSLVQMARGVSNTVSQPAITGSTSPATGHATRAKAAPTLTQNDATTTASASRNQDEQRELTSSDIANTGQKAMLALMAALKQRQK